MSIKERISGLPSEIFTVGLFNYYALRNNVFQGGEVPLLMKARGVAVQGSKAGRAFVD
jgi:hypothetical protein